MESRKSGKNSRYDSGYPSDIRDDEWSLVVSCLTLMDEDAFQREYALRDVFNGLHWIARAGAS